jgi:SAM-dependent methyltransferase
VYDTDLAYVHERGFGDYARQAAPEIERLLRAYDIFTGRVVEFGCGGGTVARHLSEAGYDVLGIDISRAMIRMARARAPAARFRVGSTADARIPTCDAIVAIGEVVTYMVNGSGDTARSARTHERQLASFFRRAAQALRPGGLLIFDFMESAARRTYEAKSRGGDDWAIALSAGVGRTKRTLARRMVIFREIGGRLRRSEETHYVRVYPRSAIMAALRRAGFEAKVVPRLGKVRLAAGDALAIARRSERGRRPVRADSVTADHNGRRRTRPARREIIG